ncbi:MAG: serine/threonine protein kinase [Deltaproteobacteria bacterium]|nr:serine/threonine protein kinase [Deltaproteobacteria bacterium]
MSSAEEVRTDVDVDAQHVSAPGAAGAPVEITVPMLETPVQRIGRYEILGHLAAGGMAEVVLARLVGPSRFERPVVIKKILPQLAKEPAFVSMFLDEARLAARVRHPNVVQVTELSDNAGELFLVMEYLEGESLAGLMRRLVSRRESLPPHLAAHVLAEAANGLHAAHELRDDEGRIEGVVHRDVSPQNLFVGYDGTVKVLDFGVAKAADRLTQTEAGQLKGKIEYMSPEQAQGRPLDRRSDVFALGVVLYEAATNRRLFKRDNKLLALKAVSEAAVRPPSAVVPELPRELDAIVMRALARGLDQRYASAAEMRADLVSFVSAQRTARPPDVELAALMQRLFEERIQEKRDMLRRVSAGSHLTHVPQAEVDVAVDLGAVDSQPREGADLDTSTERIGSERTGSLGQVSLVGEAAAPGARTSMLALGGVAVFAGLASIGVAASFAFDAAETAAPVTNVAAQMPAPIAIEPAPASSEAMTATRAVALSIDSVPTGATVSVDGTSRGLTPLVLELTRSDTPLSLRLELEGHEPLVEAIVPTESQRLRVTLVPSPRRTTRVRPTSMSTESTEPAEPRFERFD